MNYDYYYLDYYKALTVNDSADRNIYIGRTMINLGIKEYTGENLPNDIKKQLKDKREFTYKNAEYPQLKAYYYWKKEDYNGKDVYENFIPYCNNTFCEVDLLKCKEDNDIELFRTGKLSNNFYNFNYTIPMIIVE
jgi:hypothetical protein